MKTTYFLHLSGPNGFFKTISRCWTLSEGKRRASQRDLPDDDHRHWIGEYRNGALVGKYEV
jgi:hypothetical protein